MNSIARAPWIIRLPLIFVLILTASMVSLCVTNVAEAQNGAAENVESDDSATTNSAATKSVANGRTTSLVASLTIFVLAIFIGFELITKVPPTLHTPLMSGSNAISGITVVGAVLVAGAGESWIASIIGMIAVILATINAVGGFFVTDRMLSMFRKK